MRLGIAIPASGHIDRRTVADVVAAAERLGYASVWFPDHIAVPEEATGRGGLDAPFLEPLVACAWTLGSTSRILVGTDVLVAGYRHPLLVRAAAASAALLGAGRLILGVGVGYLRGEFAALGQSRSRRGQAADELLQVVRHGEPGFVQIEVPVPLWSGGNHPRALRRAALLADGWHPLFPHPRDYALAREQILTLRAQAGLTTPFTFSYSCPITRIEKSRRSHWPTNQPPKDRYRDLDYQPPLPVHEDGRPWFVGTADEFAADLLDVQQAGVDHITLRFRGEDILEQLAAGAEVATQLRRRLGQ